MARRGLVYLTVAASVLGAALIVALAADREPGVSERELDALKAEVAQIARRVDALTAPQDAPQEPAPAQSVDVDVEQLRSEVRALERQLHTLGRAASDIGAIPAYSSGPAETARSEAQLADYLDELLLQEPEGGDARRVAAELTTQVRAALPPGASLREVRCRPSLCRVEMTYPDLAAYQQFVEAHLNGGASGVWPGATFVQATDPELERGDVIAQVYLARDAHVFAPTAQR